MNVCKRISLNPKDIKVSIFIILIFLYGSAVGQSSDSLKYFPCDVGDTWFYYVQYSPGDYEYNTTRIDSVVGHPLGKLVYMSGDEYRSSTVVVDTSKAVVYGYYPDVFDSTKRYADYYHLEANVGDYWSEEPSVDSSLWWGVSAVVDTTVFWVRRNVKTFENFVGFYMGDTSGAKDHNPSNWGGTLWEDYAYGIGMTFRNVEAGEGWFLIGAILNGDSIGTILGVKEKEGNIPTQFSLSQNYPNPFNPTTTISYQLSVVTLVTLKVYDILGKEVKTLVNKKETTGPYFIQWDGTDQCGHHVASGVYYYRLTTQNGSITRKAVLVK